MYEMGDLLMVNRPLLEKEDSPALSVIIPCYNEESVIEVTVTLLSEALNKAGISYEILCVNNASSDRTENVLLRLASEIPGARYINTPSVAGYGVAVRWGLEFFTGNAVVIVMADGSEEPEDVIAFFRKIEGGYDCVFGNRFTKNASVVGYPRFKRILNRLGNALIARISHADYGDFTNGFKCYRKHVIDSMKPLYADQFNLTIEMSMNAVLSGARYAVVPNSWKDREAGVSKFKVLKQSKLYLKTIAYCWLRSDLRGKNWLKIEDCLARAKEESSRGINNAPI
jgi:dolichol-phosphate mannosyltransferase